MLKKLLAVTLALVTVFSAIACSAFSTQALSTKPTELYIGCNDEAECKLSLRNKNLAAMLLGNTTEIGYEYAGTARIKYYKDKDGNCILHLNNYEMTESYFRSEEGTSYGIYCKGDLILEIANYCTFLETESQYSYGIYVEGNLKIRCPEYYDFSVLKATGGKTGIYATKSIILENTSVTAQGSNEYGIKTGDLGVSNSVLNAKGISYGALVENNFGFNGGSITATGYTCGVSVGGTFVNSSRNYVDFDAPLVVAKDRIRIELADRSLFYKSHSKVVHDDFLPFEAKSFLGFSSSNGNASVNSNGEATGKKVGNATISLSMSIGNSAINLDSCNVSVVYLWWQKVIIYVFFGWIWYK